MPVNKKCVKSFPIWGMSYNQINNYMLIECKKKKKTIVKMNLLTKQKESHRCRKQISGYWEGTGQGRNKLGDWD